MFIRYGDWYAALVGSEKDLWLGTQVQGYTIDTFIADGAMGRVYAATQSAEGGDQKIAIKVLHAHVATDPISVERFRREYETAMDLKHVGVVEAKFFGEMPNGTPYMGMEFLRGEEMRDRITRDGTLALAPFLVFIAHVGRALAHAHSFGVIHRDLKPDNFFLVEGAPFFAVKMLDFGSVKLQVEMGPKLTAFGTTLGSPHYMSPEQAMGQADVDPRTDQFALASICYEALTGSVPFDGSNIAQILGAIINHDPALPANVPAPVGHAILKALSKDKEERFASVGEFVQAMLVPFGYGSAADVIAATEEELKTRAASLASAAQAPSSEVRTAAGQHETPSARRPDEAGVPALPKNNVVLPLVAAGLGVLVIAAFAAWYFLS